MFLQATLLMLPLYQMGGEVWPSLMIMEAFAGCFPAPTYFSSGAASLSLVAKYPSLQWLRLLSTVKSFLI